MEKRIEFWPDRRFQVFNQVGSKRINLFSGVWSLKDDELTLRLNTGDEYPNETDKPEEVEAKLILTRAGGPDVKPGVPVPSKTRTGAAAYDHFPEPDRSRYVKDWAAERDALRRAIEDDKVRLTKATTDAERKKYGDYVRTYTKKLARHERNDPLFFLRPPPPKSVTVAPAPKLPAESAPAEKPMAEVVKVRLESVRVVETGANAVMVYVDWKNTGTRPARSVRATIKAFDAKGKEVYSSEALIYEALKDSLGVAPGGTYTEPKGKGHAVPNEPGKTPIRATVEITKVEENGK